MKNILKTCSILISLLTLTHLKPCYGISSEPLVLLISFDGFRWDYLKRFNLSNFEYLKQVGSHAEFIQSSFSTVTFPNHWTIVTGMYEETHGIIQNEMWDPVLNRTFSYKSNESQTHEWFAQNKETEPIWIANQKAGDGRLSAVEWVGGGISFKNESAIYIPYNKSKDYNDLFNEFIVLFTRKEEPINFGAIYFDEPDHTGHTFGPYSKELEEKLYSLNAYLGYFIDQLKSNDLFDKMNLIITSDHGMEEISERTSIFLDSYIDTDLFELYGSPTCQSVFVKTESDINYVYRILVAIENLQVYKKNDIPERLHYKNNPRIGDLLIVPKLGYTVYSKNQTIDWNSHRGDHGYDNNESNMYPIFISHGPAFKQNYTVNTFKNVDIYPLMCLILGVEPGVNNGSLANVLNMIAYEEIEREFDLVFVLLFIIPFTILMLIVLCTYIWQRKRSRNNSDSQNDPNHSITDENQSESRILIE